MAFSSKAKGLLLAGPVAVLMLAAAPSMVDAEPVVSSYYGGELAGSPTASGEPFDPRGLTAAHPSLPLGTVLTASYNGRSVNVRVNDRGPYVHGRGLDLSLGAAQTLGLTGPGTGVVDIKPAKAAKSPATPYKPATPARTVSSVEAAPSYETREKEERPRFFSAGMLTPPGERIIDSIGKPSSQSREIDSYYGATLFEEPPVTQLPEAKENQNSQPLHFHLTVPGRRRAA